MLLFIIFSKIAKSYDKKYAAELTALKKSIVNYSNPVFKPATCA